MKVSSKKEKEKMDKIEKNKIKKILFFFMKLPYKTISE